MRAAERRIETWVDLIGDLLAQPRATYPRRTVGAALHHTFGCQVVWNWMDAGAPGMEPFLPMGDWPSPEVRQDLARAIWHHPVLRWFALTGDLTPTTVGRVPSGMVTARGRRVLQDHFAPRGMQEHLAIPFRLGVRDYRAFVLARGDADFPDEDLRVAAALRPLLALLDRQVTAYGAPVPPDAGGLTGRELAVVRLLARGLTAAAIGGRLGISERTVHRHLQGAYRKLGAHDRLSAVLAAHEAGMVPGPADGVPVR